MTIAYLLAASCFSLLTPAWENNDEFQHVQYIEYIARTGQLPAIRLRNGWESGQPPLYYESEVLWQRLLNIPAFVPKMLPTAPASTNPVHLELLHRYSVQERQQAIWVHELRAFSILCGLVTVWGSFGVAWLATRRGAVATSAAAFVALLPKEVGVFGAVTNDSLVTALCTLGLLSVIFWAHASPAQRRRRISVVLAAGLIFGLAAITKYTALPVAGLMFAAVLGFSWRRRLGPWDCIIGAGAALCVGGWWYARNVLEYGQLLATSANERMLKAAFPGNLLIQNFTLSHFPQWIDVTARGVAQTFWYVGLWNQLTIPSHLSYALWLAAAASGIVGLWRMVGVRGGNPEISTRFIGACLAAAVLGGVLAALSVASASTQAQGRYLYVGVAGIATLMAVGIDALTSRRSRLESALALTAWPLVLLALLAWVVAVYVVPLAGL